MPVSASDRLRRRSGPRRESAPSCAAPLLLALVWGCNSSSLEPDGQGGAPASTDGDALSLVVAPDSRTFVELSEPEVLELEGDGGGSIAWDLAFQGRDVFTNGGISGPGNASAFGPLTPPTFLSDTAPKVPIMLKDRAGGALLDWYDYAGDDHQLYSRYHVYGLRDGARFFKLQILSYYGDRLGAPIAARYRIRFAEVLESGARNTVELEQIDATSGGDGSDDSQPSGCLELDTERVRSLTPAEAAASEAWHLCFRREGIAVNGGLSGPRGVEAVDLQGDATLTETEAEVRARTADSELPLFDGVDYAALSDPALDWIADGVATAFGRRWLSPGSDPAELSDHVWLVVAADGASKYLLKFESLSGDLGNDEASLSLRAKAVR